MTIIPADKTDAAWNVYKQLENVLGFARHPHPAALGDDWADACKQNIIAATDSAKRSFAGDSAAIQKLKSVRSLALEFIAVMIDRPMLSAIPPEAWNVRAYRQLFDDLSSLERKFRIIGEQSGNDDSAVVPAVEHPEQPKIVFNDDPAIQRIHDRVTASDFIEGTKNKICQEVAEKFNRNGESLRTSYNRLIRKSTAKPKS